MARLIKVRLERDKWDKDHTKKWVSDIVIAGKRIHRALSFHKPEAKRMLQDMQDEARARRHGEIVQNKSWSIFRQEILDDSDTTQDRKTYLAYRRSFELVDRENKILYVHQMTPDRLHRTHVALLKDKKLGRGAVAKAIRTMKTIMRIAQRKKYIPLQDWTLIPVVEPEGRKDFFPRDRFLVLLSKLSGPWFDSALIMGRAGLRLGELLHLQLKDVHLSTNEIIFRSKPELDWKIKKDEKLKKIRRVPLLTNDIRDRLRQILEERHAAGAEPTDWVLPLTEMPSRREDVYSRMLIAAMEDTAVKTEAGRFGHPHILRHTFGSHMAQIGVPPKMLAEWMGHNSIRMTEGYMHLAPGDSVNDIALIEKLCFTFVPGYSLHGSTPINLTHSNRSFKLPDSPS